MSIGRSPFLLLAPEFWLLDSAFSAHFLLRERPCERVRWIVRIRCQRLAIVFQGVRLIAQLLVGLSDHHQNERIVLVGLLKIRQRCLEIASIERDVTQQIRKERRLLRIAAIVEDGLRGFHMLPGFRFVPTPGRDARLRVFPAEIP